MSLRQYRVSRMLKVLVLLVLACAVLNLSWRYTKTLVNSLTSPESTIQKRVEAKHEPNQDKARTSVYKRRHIELRQNCAIIKGKYSNTACDQEAHPPNLIWVRKRGFAICLIQKSGSSYLESLLKLSSSQPQNANLIRNKTIKHGILKSKGKVIFVRDPYARILAGYTDKFLIPNPFYWKVGRTIVQRFRANASKKSLRCGHDVTFPEYISYVIAGSGDIHWRPAHQLCCPCNRDYDVIGKLETMVADVSFVMNRYNISLDILTGDIKDKTTVIFLKTAVNAIFERLRTPFLRSCFTIEEGLRRMFLRQKIRGLLDTGLEFDVVLSHAKNVTQEQVKKAIVKAYRSHKLSSSVASLNRRRALIEAYRTISPNQLNLLSEKYYPDFALFGYDPKPVDIFSSSSGQAESGYTIIGPPFF